MLVICMSFRKVVTQETEKVWFHWQYYILHNWSVTPAANRPPDCVYCLKSRLRPRNRDSEVIAGLNLCGRQPGGNERLIAAVCPLSPHDQQRMFFSDVQLLTTITEIPNVINHPTIRSLHRAIHFAIASPVR